MTEPTKLDKVMADEILDAIRSKFDLKTVSDIKITSIEIDREEHEIRIDLMITTTETPEVLAQNYFGLTGTVRRALGADWSGFFPVITPQFHSGVHA